jgi:putative endopeptidase
MKRFMATVALLGCLSPVLPGQEIHTVFDGDGVDVPVPKSGVSLDLGAIDKSVNPCGNFYQYACGNWRKNNPIPADKARWGRFDELAERNRYSVYLLLKQAADKPVTPLQVKYGSYFAACMNQAQADQVGAKPIDPVLSRIDAWHEKKQLPSLLAELEDQFGVGLFYDFGSEQDQKDSQKQIAVISQGGLTLPDRDYYLQQDGRTRSLREKFVAHMVKMFVLLGDSQERATREAHDVLAIETSLAQASTSRVDLRDPANIYHVMPLTELQRLTPDYRWGSYFQGLRRTIPLVNVATPNFFKELDRQIALAPIDAIRSYMRWHVLHASAPSLSTAFDDENFDFFGRTLSGQKERSPRWKRCTAATDDALGEAVGQDWVSANFPPAAKQNMLEMVHALEASLSWDIASIDWMGAETKAQAQKKLAAFREKIGYPDVWRDYSKLTVNRDDRMGNAFRVRVFEDRHELDKIGKPVDEREWGMTPPTVNAYYDPSNNDINFPAGILQPPFYDFHMDPAVNFGAIGVVIGHEMTHGFDDQGSQFDAQGNVRMWWTTEDKKRFDERSQCLVNEYGSFEPVPGAKLNGKLTLGENTADNGGLHLAYSALHSELGEQDKSKEPPLVDGYTPDQRYFLAYAQIWCENTREETARLRAKTDPHSPGQFRVNGAVQNFDKFGEAFSCKQGEPMYPANSCRVW